MLRLSLLFLAAHTVAALYFIFDRAPGTGAAFSGFPLDDAWIHMVYARSLAGLHGFAYNPGQLETGSTSPLWAILLVPASWVARLGHVSVVVPAKVTCILTAVATSVGAARLLRALGLGIAAELAAGLAIAADPWLAFAQVSGMEVMLAAALALWAFAVLAEGRLRYAVLAAALAALARPEMVLVTVGVLVLAEWRLHEEHASARARLWLVAPALISLGAWVAYCLAVSGYPLPNTFYAKFASREDYLVHNLALVFGQILPAAPWFASGVGVLAWAYGAFVIGRQGLVGRVVLAFPFVYFLAVSSSQLLQAAEPFYFLRYLLPAHAMVVATLAVGVTSAVKWAWQHRRSTWAPAHAVGIVILIAALLVRLPRAVRERADLFAWNCQNIEELDVAMALWLRDNVPVGEPIAVNDAGAAGYFAGHSIVDMLGLNHHGLVHREPAAMAELGRVGYIAAFPSLLSQVRDSPDWSPVHRTHTQNLTICKCPQSEIVAYRRAR